MIETSDIADIRPIGSEEVVESDEQKAAREASEAAAKAEADRIAAEEEAKRLAEEARLALAESQKERALHLLRRDYYLKGRDPCIAGVLASLEPEAVAHAHSIHDPQIEKIRKDSEGAPIRVRSNTPPPPPEKPSKPRRR